MTHLSRLVLGCETAARRDQTPAWAGGCRDSESPDLVLHTAPVVGGEENS